MKEFVDHLKSLERNQLILTAAQLKKSTLPEPIAIVGIGCRFPGGVDSASSFWQMVSTGQDTSADITDKRWSHQDFFDQNPDEPGKTYVNRMALLEHCDRFDAAFFNIHGTEAELMDPQQRWLLEDAWYALEDAGINPTSLNGSEGGVFIGVSNHDYEQLQNASGRLEDLSGYSAIGSATSVTAGRLSYFLGLQGPALVIDTACSSSLVSVHQACQSLRSQECNFALAGGVNAILSPMTTIAESKAMMLSPSGACHTYDDSADGYMRGEGSGLVVLKRLSDAKADGDRIYAVIKGSAVNQDGASQGLTAPNGPSQQRVINRALQQAGLKGEDIGFVETHGTGTPLGDPIEMSALDACYGMADRQNPVAVSSLKTNIGHTEATAGVAGLIKLTLARYHGLMPKHLGLKKLNKHLENSAERIKVLTSNEPWPEANPFGAVSSFGFSGTNCHLVLGPAPKIKAPQQPNEAAEQSSGLPIVTASAKHTEALQELVAAYQDKVSSTSCPEDIAHASHYQRAHHPLRCAWLLGETPKVTQESLKTSQMGWLFTGQGSQYAGMGQSLYENHQNFHCSVFKHTLDECAAIFSLEYDFPLTELLWGEKSDLLNSTQFTQPALFALEIALAKQWQAWKLQPEALVGHSIGEYAAACMAEVFTLAEAMVLIMARGRLMTLHCERGGMLSAMASSSELEQYLVEFPTLNIAAYNTPKNQVVAGELPALEHFEVVLTQNKVRFKRLNVSHAFHSQQMEAMTEAFRECAQGIQYQTPKLPIYSSQTGERIDQAMTEAEYWVTHVRAPVRFEQAIQTAAEAGTNTWLEIGPSNTLSTLGQRCLENSAQHRWQASLIQGSQHNLYPALASLYSAGTDIKWHAIEPIAKTRPELPFYPFRQTQYWYQPERVFSRPSHSGKETKESREAQVLTTYTEPKTNEPRLKQDLINLDTEDQWLTLVSLTRRTLAEVLVMEEEEISLDVDLFDIGLDSMKAMDLRTKVQQELGIDLSPRLLFDAPNVIALVDHFGIEQLNLWEISPVAEELES